MFTVKQITLSGIENIWECHTVQYYPATARPEPQTSDVKPFCGGDAVAMNVVGGDAPVEIFGGTVFVMNSAGKTVSRYDLGPSTVRFGDDPHCTARYSNVVTQP